jgi:cytochrome c-type biogenesis protein CcmH
MIWIAFLLLAAVCLLPLAYRLGRAPAIHGRRAAAIALHRGQLAEIARDLAEGRLHQAEYDQAKLEIERRLLADAALADPASASASRPALLAALVLIPVAAGALYWVGGRPDLPAEPLAVRLAQLHAREAEEDHLIGALRARLATMDPKTEQARQGYVLLGGAEANRGRLQAAADAWRVALAARFDPVLAVRAAEAMYEADGKLSLESSALFRRALAEAPADAPWRAMVQKRLDPAGAAPNPGG